MVVEQGDLIDVGETAIGRRKQPWCEMAGATRQRCCQSARTAVDLPVPLRPQMRTPPIDGSIALRMRASRIFCCSTIALNGNVVIFLPSRDAGYIFSCCQTQECCMLPPGQVSCQKHVLSCQITGIDR